jgi:ubiquinone/menaquinone biosynthesis C-methylase UbiE
MTFADAKQRFSNRVADYVRYRPSYPSALVDVLRDECDLRSDHVIADVGSGTGILSKMFLENGNRVFGIEPNDEMRHAGEEYLSVFKNFSSITGSAEATSLPDTSVDFVTVAQAFHWFEPVATRREFQRILRPAGFVVIVWNQRLFDTTPFLRDYEALLHRFGTDYGKVSESYPRKAQIQEFFSPSTFSQKSFPNFQEFDFDGVRGWLRGSSYVPGPDHPAFAAMMAELERVFAAHQRNGQVSMDYTTHIYFGRFAAMRNSA